MNQSILTATGKYFNFRQPEPEHIDIVDIATALSRICRFTGHTTAPYSVAQHSVHVSELVPPEHALAGLLHDASEAYLGDVSSPLKSLLPDYRAIEDRVERVIMQRFGVPYPFDPSIKLADMMMLVTERRDLMPQPRTEFKAHDSEAWAWERQFAPCSWHITPWSPETAKHHFLERFDQLTRSSTK